MDANAYLNYGYVNWYECSSIAHVQSPSIYYRLILRPQKGFMSAMTLSPQAYLWAYLILHVLGLSFQHPVVR